MSLAEQSQQWYPTSVQVTVLQARGLRIKGKNGTNDAYAIMQVAKEKFSTSVAEKSVAPVWKEEANFDLPLFHPSNTERCTLQVSVMHRALVGPDKMLGLAIVNLLELHDKTSRNKSEWFKLMGKTGKPDKDRGEVLIDIQFMKNNMTASMFDLSGPDKSRSRLGKFKDKLKGKKKDGMSDSASAIVPSMGQIMTDSEGEEEAEATPGTKKKSKLKSLFAPKGLHRNMSQSMSTLATLPEKDSAISLSRSSGLNVESPEGKKKFKLFKHKRTGSSDSKASQGAGSLGQGIAQGNVCINGSHVYTEDPETRESRAGSTFSLNSSGHGSMEDLRRGPNRKISTTSVDSDLQTQENALEEMHRRQEEQRKREEEIRKRLEEEKRRQIKEEEREQLRREEMRKEEERNRIEREEERRRIEREEEKRRLEKQEEERRRIEREEEKRRLEKQEEERRRIEREEEKRRLEKQEEERRRIEREEEKKRLEKQEGERRRIEREEEKRRLEKLEEERRRIEREEERKRIEKEEEMKRIEKEMKEQRKMEEEEIERKEEMVRIKREQENVSQEEERKKAEDERMREEEENRIREEMRKRMEEEDRTRIEKERMMKEEATRRIEVEKRRAEEEERLQKEKREAEEKRKRKEEEERRMTEEKEKKEKERLRLEKERMELEKNEKEEMERIREEEKRKKAEQERIRQEKDELEKQKKEKEQMNIIERPEVKPRSARMNTSKRAEKADTIGSEYVLPTNPFEEALLLDENSTNLFEQSSVPQPEAPRSSSKVKPSSVSGTFFSQASVPNTNPFLEDSDAICGKTENIVSLGDGAERSEKKRRAPVPPQNKTQVGKPDVPPRNLSSTPVSGTTETHPCRASEDSGEPDVSSSRRDKRPAPLPPDISKNRYDVLSKEHADQSSTSFQEVFNPFISPGIRTAKHNKGSAPAKPSIKSTLRENSAIVPEPNNLTISHVNLIEHTFSPDETSPISDSCVDQLDESSNQSGENLDNLLVSEVTVSKPESVHFDFTDSLSLRESEKEDLTTVSCSSNASQNTEDVSLESVDLMGVSKKKSRAPLPPKLTMTGYRKSTNLQPAAVQISQPNRHDHDRTLTINSGLSTSSFCSPTLNPSTPSQAPEMVQGKTEYAALRAEEGHGSGNKSLPQATVSPIDAQPDAGPNNVGERKKTGDPAFKPCRPHAVKPLSTIDNHPDFKENQDNFTSSKIADGVQVKMKVPEAKGTPKGAGPYSQLTHEELVNLLEKQKDQLSKKDAKIVELEQYIDNLLVRVIEEKPSILMTLSSMKKSF